MTQEHLVVVDLADIQKLQLECRCGASVSYSPDKRFELPFKCHQCLSEWRHALSPTVTEQIIELFSSAIVRTIEQQRANEKGLLKIKLVFNGAKAETR